MKLVLLTAVLMLMIAGCTHKEQATYYSKPVHLYDYYLHADVTVVDCNECRFEIIHDLNGVSIGTLGWKSTELDEFLTCYKIDTSIDSIDLDIYCYQSMGGHRRFKVPISSANLIVDDIRYMIEMAYTLPRGALLPKIFKKLSSFKS